MGDLLEAMRAFGESFTARQAGQVRRGQDLMAEAQDVLGSAGIRLVLALLKAGRIPYPDAPWWPVFLSELVRHDPGEPLYVALPAPRPKVAAEPPPAEPINLADEMRAMGMMYVYSCSRASYNDYMDVAEVPYRAAAVKFWGEAGACAYDAYDRIRPALYPDLPAQLPIVIGITAYGHCLGLTRGCWREHGPRISLPPEIFQERPLRVPSAM